MAKKVFSVRLDPVLHEKVSNYDFAADGFKNRNIWLEEIFEALIEGRLVVRPQGIPDAFPKESVPFGSTPSNPIYVAFPKASKEQP